jgi:pimeloyl-ACP methyl ester carboxylesterase
MTSVREVVVVHGVWAPGVFMAPLAARLAREGFRCHRYGYRGQRSPLAANAAELARLAQDVGPAHFVGHSLGGLVILRALNDHPEIAVGNVVLLGTPARGSFSGRRLARHRVGRWMLGETHPLWHDLSGMRWERPEPLGVIAGTLSMGLGRALGRLPGPNDGVVCVDETAVEGMRERIALRVGHSAMLVSARVAAQTAAFLREGKFRDEAP